MIPENHGYQDKLNKIPLNTERINNLRFFISNILWFPGKTGEINLYKGIIFQQIYR